MFKNRKIIYIFLIILTVILFSLFTIKNKTKLISASTDTTRFISFGDNPHVPEAQVKDYLSMLIASINNKKVSLVIHVGDTLGGREPCNNSMIDLQKGNYESNICSCFIYSGDNEWRDCYQKKS